MMAAILDLPRGVALNRFILIIYDFLRHKSRGSLPWKTGFW